MTVQYEWLSCYSYGCHINILSINMPFLAISVKIRQEFPDYCPQCVCKSYIESWTHSLIYDLSLGQANLIKLIVSHPLSILPPLISLLPLSIMCTRISVLRRLDIIFTAQPLPNVCCSSETVVKRIDYNTIYGSY